MISLTLQGWQAANKAFDCGFALTLMDYSIAHGRGFVKGIIPTSCIYWLVNLTAFVNTLAEVH